MSRNADTRKRILLFAEAVTLAHVARPLAFAQGLAAEKYRVTVAVAPHAAQHVEAAGLSHLALDSISPETFLRRLADGKPLYDSRTLAAYVEDELRLIRAFGPDLIVGDFRLSLSISARLANVPYASIASAYWSPFYQPRSWPVPSLPLTRVLPLAFARGLFSAVRPLAFRLHCRPLNAARRRYGLDPLPDDLRRIYTDADFVLYSDVPSLFPMSGLPNAHRFLGPALWEPVVELPAWWDELPTDRPVVYVTLGSSGDPTLLPGVLRVLSKLPVTVIAASAGRGEDRTPRRGVFAATYLPGLKAARRAQLVICNGGSLTCYQALAAGVPVLGIAGNLDQFLNMQGVEGAGGGMTLRADRWSPARLTERASLLLHNAQTRAATQRLQAQCSRLVFASEAAAFVHELLGDG